MRTSARIALTLLGAVAQALGLGLLLVFGRYSAVVLASGVLLVLVPWLVLLCAPRARRRSAWGTWLGAMVVTVAVWTVARYGVSAGPEPEPPAAVDAGEADSAASARALARGLQMAREALVALDAVADYTCTWSKRERARSILGRVRLTDERLVLKVRHRPFSVYVRYVEPAGKRGTEAIYVEGRNAGRLIAHSTRSPLDLLGTVRLEPTEWMAMLDQRYPITRVGLRTLAEEVLRLADEHAAELATCRVRFLPGETVDGRPCDCMEVAAPAPMPGFALALARISFDAAWGVPVRLERWDHVPEGSGHERRLVEAYAATDLQFDRGLSDLDFDPENPEYGY